MNFILGLIAGFILGVILIKIAIAIITPTLGTLQIDERNPEDVKWRLVIDKEFPVSKHKKVFLKVNKDIHLS